MDILTITSTSLKVIISSYIHSFGLLIGLKNRDNRKIVYLMARQHPGEVTGSFMIEGAINFLTENTP